MPVWLFCQHSPGGLPPRLDPDLKPLDLINLRWHHLLCFSALEGYAPPLSCAFPVPPEPGSLFFFLLGLETDFSLVTSWSRHALFTSFSVLISQPGSVWQAPRTNHCPGVLDLSSLGGPPSFLLFPGLLAVLLCMEACQNHRDFVFFFAHFKNSRCLTSVSALKSNSFGWC